jgi:hypothetical protein
MARYEREDYGRYDAQGDGRVEDYAQTRQLPRTPAAPAEPAVDARKLWSGGLATAVVAGLIGLVGLLIVRALLQIPYLAPEQAGALGDERTIVLVLGAAAAALAATGLAHLLLVSTPRPLAYLGWIVGLGTAIAAVLPLLEGGPLAVRVATSAIHLAIGLAIGSLATGTAMAASGRTRQR